MYILGTRCGAPKRPVETRGAPMTWSAAERRHRHVGICISYNTFNITMTIDFREPADHGITIRVVFGVVSSQHLQHGSVSSQHPHPGLPPRVMGMCQIWMLHTTVGASITPGGRGQAWEIGPMDCWRANRPYRPCRFNGDI